MYSYLIALDEGVVVPICATCEISRPNRSKHCKDCNRCIYRFDHHCIYIYIYIGPWIGNCVGIRNHKYFIFFLIFSLIHIISFTLLLYFMVKLNNTLQFFTNMDGITIAIGGLFCFMYLLCFIYYRYDLNILYVQLKNISRNITTNESLNWNHYSYLKNKINGSFCNPYDKGMKQNIIEFFTSKNDERRTGYQSIPTEVI